MTPVWFMTGLKVSAMKKYAQPTLAVPKSCFSLGARATFDRYASALLPASATGGGRAQTTDFARSVECFNPIKTLSETTPCLSAIDFIIASLGLLRISQ